MCELLGISSRHETAVSYSFPEFARFGSHLRSNREGWGIAFGQDRDAVVVREPHPAAESPWVRFIAEHEIASRTVIAHVRHATRGAPGLGNTHPFKRILGGRVHLFAHNGTLEGIEDRTGGDSLFLPPVGETDSELAFCALLARLAPAWKEAGGPPEAAARFGIFAQFAGEMARLGPANFLYYDGDCLFVHAHRRVWEEDGRLTEPKPPGLHIKNCLHCAAGPDYSWPGLKVGLEDQRTLIVASVPLELEGWEPLAEGTALALRGGDELARARTL